MARVWARPGLNSAISLPQSLLMSRTINGLRFRLQWAVQDPGVRLSLTHRPRTQLSWRHGTHNLVRRQERGEESQISLLLLITLPGECLYETPGAIFFMPNVKFSWFIILVERLEYWDFSHRLQLNYINWGEVPHSPSLPCYLSFYPQYVKITAEIETFLFTLFFVLSFLLPSHPCFHLPLFSLLASFVNVLIVLGA